MLKHPGPISQAEIVKRSQVEIIERLEQKVERLEQKLASVRELPFPGSIIWSLASVMLSGQLIDINGYIYAYMVNTDVTAQHEVSLKLTAGSIKALNDYHKKSHCALQRIEEEIFNKLHNQFATAVNRFGYRVSVTKLKKSEESDTGELLCGEGEKVKNNIMELITTYSIKRKGPGK
ncbi:hypothetical protein V495_00180 [Pseudogymnoascus sp. VKM F-4514 (FW-929)]|nr:hypothetical protein V495_00180 [Pseudogymnoascus sp. VKM F-4514 (FW-929)]KFY66823.1 hypothetical protein V497_00666 [Pseudogymnoascus sp. VKM F-4516 (FW-969)]